MSKAERITDVFPAPSFREYQKPTIKKAVEAFEEGKDVVAISAPTGAGKSLINYTAAKGVGGACYTTPINNLVDQMDNDEFIGDNVLTIKGRNNYDCIHPEDRGTSVDEAICQRDDEFDCELKESECPYYWRRHSAVQHPFVVTNMHMAMADSMLPDEVDTKIGQKDVLVVDEVQNVEDASIGFVGMSLDRYKVPEQVLRHVNIPEKDEVTVGEVKDWIVDEFVPALTRAHEQLYGGGELSKSEVKVAEKVENLNRQVQWFMKDSKEHKWIASKEVDVLKNQPNVSRVKLQPVYVGRFLDDMLWSKGEKVIVSSATIPGGSWFDEVGLGDKDIVKISVPSTFPPENRRVITGHAVGKMTYNKREDNMGDMAEKIKQMAEHHGSEKGMVHCRAYSIAESLARWYSNNGHRDWYKDNVVLQDQEDREGSLETWVNGDKPLFLSVGMSEGIDLEGDKCRYQVLAKTLYPSMKDDRVEYRVSILGSCDECGHEEEFRDEDVPNKCPECEESGFSGDWDWYNTKAAIQIQQATGRAVRSEEDEAIMYVLDESAISLIKRNAELFETWFLNALDFKIRGQDKSKAVVWE